MAASAKFSFVFFLLAFSLFVEHTFSADRPEISPAPSPESGADSPSPIAHVPAPLHDPASSPPAPSPETPSPGSSPSPSPASSPSPSPSAAPAPADNADVKHNGVEDDSEEKSSGGMSPGRKAGIAVGVIAAGCVVGLAGIVYKKRQQNIRRAQIGYAARREIL